MKNRSAYILHHSDSRFFTEEEAYGIILSNLDDIFVLIDKELVILTLNELAQKTIFQSYGARVVPGMSVLDIVPDEYKSEITGVYNDVFKGNIRTYLTDEKSKGSIIHLEYRFKPVANENGEIIAALVTARNITEYKKVELALKEMEERWRFALEGANQGVWDWNLQTNEIVYSASYRKMYGFEAHELADSLEEWENRIHPDDKKLVNQAIDQHTSSSNPYYENIYRIKGKDEQYRWIMARGMIMGRDSKGKPLRMIGTHTDITDRIKAEEKYKQLFYNNPLPMWTYDLESLRFLEVNNAAIAHYGYTREEFLSMTIADIRPEEEKIRLVEAVKNANRKIFLPSTWKHKKKNGDIIHVEITTTKQEREGRDVVLVLANDITETVIAQEELIISNERFSYAAKASSEALWEWDIETGEVYMSDVYNELFGWKTDEKKNFDAWHIYVHPEDRNETISGYYQAIEDPSVHRWSKEYRYLKANGSYAIVIDKAVILRNNKGKATRVIGAMQDVTIQKKAEDELKKSNERFLFVSRATSDAIYDWDIVTDELYWGDALHTLFGYNPTNLPIGKWEDMLHPEDRKETVGSMYKAINSPGEQFWKKEYRFKKADGSFSYVLDRGFFIRDEQDKVVRMIGSMQDISEGKYHERLLSLERTIFELTTNQKLDFKYIVNVLLKGIEDIHEDAFTSLFLLKDDGSVSKIAAPRLPRTFTDMIEGFKPGPNDGSCGAAISTKKTVIVADIENDPLWEDHKGPALQHGIKACWSLPIIHSSGMVMGTFANYFKTVKNPSPSEWNTIERIRNILRVLMENYWSINEIRLAKERFDTVLKATHDLIWDWNLETGEMYRDPNGLMTVYGVKNKQSIQKIDQWIKRIHPEDQERVQKVIDSILHVKSQDIFDVEYRFIRDDGSISYVYDRGMLIRDREGRPIRFIGAAQDITDRKRLEQELLQNELERQKAINQATVDTQEQERSEIGKELHDNVNQVLTTTKLYLDLALSNPELKDDLISKSSKNIIKVINEIRQLSRSLMDPSIGDLGLIDSIKDLIENINMTRKLHVRLHAEKKMEYLLGKNHKLTVFRIIQEVLNNAIRHSKASTVSIYFSMLHENAEIIIEDDGIGFDPVQIKKGAGLKNIENRIYLINGTHSVFSAPDKGCKIIINFPVNKQYEYPA